MAEYAKGQETEYENGLIARQKDLMTAAYANPATTPEERANITRDFTVARAAHLVRSGMDKETAVATVNGELAAFDAAKSLEGMERLSFAEQEKRLRETFPPPFSEGETVTGSQPGSYNGPLAELHTQAGDAVRKRLAAFTADPAAYAAELLGEKNTPAENVALQQTLAENMPDFTPRILPRAEIAALKETLVNPEIPNRERLDTFLQCKTACGDHGDAALDELELPHPVREAVTLASTDPAQATFAAELLGAMVTGDIHEKKTAAKLTCLAGTNPSAQALLDTLMEKHEPLDDTGAYQVAGAVTPPGEKAALAAREGRPEADPKGLFPLGEALRESRAEMAQGELGSPQQDGEKESPGMKASFIDGVQDGISGLAARMKEADYLTPEERKNMDPLDKLAHSVGRFLSDTPSYAVGGIGGTYVGGSVGGLVGAFAAEGGIRAGYIDAIRNGELKTSDDLLRRIRLMGYGTMDGAVLGAGTATGTSLGVGLATKAGLGFAGKMTAGAAGEVAGLTTVGGLLRGEWPTAEDFIHNATVILGLRSFGAAAGKAKEAVNSETVSPEAITTRLQDIFAETGMRPERVGEIVKEDATVAKELAEGQKVPGRIRKEMKELEKAYERVKEDPLGGPADEVLTALQVSDIEKVFIERGPAIMRDGEVVVQGRALKQAGLAKRGFGLVKIIFRHGEKGNKTPNMPEVTKADVVNLPLYTRKYQSMADEGVKIWRIPREDGNHLVVVAGEKGRQDGMRLVSMFVDQPTKKASEPRQHSTSP
ncbi:MAG: hypothetical protein DELT_01732 [Desulfovibrio sp.]